MNFVTDRNLGKLAKWLRILGYDTVTYGGDIDLKFVRDAQDNGRTVLTRKKFFYHLSCPGNVAVVRHDRLPDQLIEVSELFSLSWDRDLCFSRCLKCNELLQVIDRWEARGCVSDYVWQNTKSFKKCLSCGGIFWPGTHHKKIKSFIMNHNRFHLP